MHKEQQNKDKGQDRNQGENLQKTKRQLVRMQRKRQPNK